MIQKVTEAGEVDGIIQDIIAKAIKRAGSGFDFEFEDELEIDITDVPEDDYDQFKKQTLSIETGGTGDPEACAEGGRQSCGRCRACETSDIDFIATRDEIKIVDGRKIASFSIEFC